MLNPDTGDETILDSPASTPIRNSKKREVLAQMATTNNGVAPSSNIARLKTGFTFEGEFY